MYKIITIFSLREGYDMEDTLKVWREQHVPDVSQRPGLVKYVMNWSKESFRGENVFGVVELWYKDYESAKGIADATKVSKPDEFAKRLYHVTRFLAEEVEVPVPKAKK